MPSSQRNRHDFETASVPQMLTAILKARPNAVSISVCMGTGIAYIIDLQRHSADARGEHAEAPESSRRQARKYEEMSSR